jgi:hypothetical protein
METDKILHILVGVILGMAGMLCTQSVFIAIGIAMAVGLMKEVWDYLDEADGIFDFWDLVATTIGGFLGTGFVILCAIL